MPVFGRVLLKLSGEALMGAAEFGLDAPTVDTLARELVAAEREILENSDEVRSKPENVREKIVEGMLNKRFYAESVLEEQAWIHDTGLTVKQALEHGGLQLLDYAWFSLG